MRILLMPSSYLPVLGGVQTVAKVLAHELMSKGHDVQVLTNRYPRNLPAKEMVDGVVVRRLLFLYPHFRYLMQERPDLFLAGFFCLPATLLGLNRLVLDFKPEVVNVHFPDSQNQFVLWLKKRNQFRLVVSLHGYEIEGYDKASADGQGVLKAVLQEADVVTACSKYLLEMATKIEPRIVNKGHIIYNGIDQIRFQNKQPHVHSKPYILSYGRLCRQKGFDLLIEAFSSLASTYPGIDLIIAGDGEDEKNLKLQSQKLKLLDRIHFFGRATPEQVLKLLNGSEFLVVPSRWEPFGIVALEGMAAAKAVIATKVGGLAEFVDQANNKLVDPTVEALANGMLDWLNRPEEVKEMGKRNAGKALALQWDRTVNNYLQVYHGS